MGHRSGIVAIFVGCGILALARTEPALADPSFTLSGSLVTATGNPACGTLIVTNATTASSVSAAIVDGVFSLVVPDGEDAITITSDGCATTSLPAQWQLPAFPFIVSADATLNVALPTTAALSLTVSTSSGSPAVGALINGTDTANAYSTAGQTLAPTQTLSGTTDETGHVTLDAFVDSDVSSLDIAAPGGAGTAVLHHLALTGAKPLALALSNGISPRDYSPPGPPTGLIAFPTGSLVTPNVRVSWLPPSMSGGLPITDYQVVAHPGGLSTYSPASLTSVLVPGLEPATEYTFTVVASNDVAAGTESAPSAPVIPNVFDTTPPVSAMTGPAAIGLAAAAPVTWSATDASGIGSYDLRWRTAREDGVFSGYLKKGSLTATTATNGNVAIAAGSTMCFSVRAKDRAGNLGDWSSERCTTRPTDDASLAASPGWSVSAPSSAYLRTLSTGGLDATLQRLGTTFGQLTLVVNTCRTCGTVEVAVDGVVIGTIDTYSAGPKVIRKVLLPLTITDGLTVHSGTVTLRVASPTRTVQIDGLALIAP